MRIFGRCVAILLLFLPLSGCSFLHLHRSQAQAPPLDTSQGKLEQEQQKNHQAPPPSSLPQPAAQTAPPQLPPEKPVRVKHPKKKKKKEKEKENAASTAEPNAPPATQSVAAVSASQPAHPVDSSPIGPLTSGDAAASANTKRDTLAMIRQTQNGLARIKRPLSSDEQTTAVQIRTFLSQSKQALDIGDLDGAQTLATKAKLLLDELLKR